MQRLKIILKIVFIVICLFWAVNLSSEFIEYSLAEISLAAHPIGPWLGAGSYPALQ
jgi:hypothetical protein